MTKKNPSNTKGLDRRELLIGAVPSLAVIAAMKATSVPVVPFGPHKISRLIVGGNPISGTSHFSNEMNREMVDYFSAGNVKKLLKDSSIFCLEGVNVPSTSNK